MAREMNAAQKIYVDHQCNHKLMNDDGSIDLYNEYNISTSTEIKWQELYKADLIRNLHMAANDQKIEYAKKLADITNRTNDFDCLIALFNETKDMYRTNDVQDIVKMCEIIPQAINPMMLTSNYVKVREIVIDVMDMLEVLLRKDIKVQKKQEIRASLDINDIKKTLLNN